MDSDPRGIKSALARAGIYRLLSLGFGYPGAAVGEEFRLSRDCLRRAPITEGLRHLVENLDPRSPKDLEGEYLRLFDTRVACSSYESEYSSGAKAFTKSRDLADIQGYYAAFGFALAVAAGEFGDHICVELEFMSLLCLKEAYFLNGGPPDEAAEIVKAGQQSFFRNHLGRWGPAFLDRLIEASQLTFYQSLVALSRAFLSDELAAMAPESCSGVAPELWSRNSRFEINSPLASLAEDEKGCFTCPMGSHWAEIDARRVDPD